MRLPALPVRTAQDATLNFDKIGKVLPDFVTVLPSGARDGQEVYYVADATNGVVWRFRYRAASTSIYKWEFVGGAALRAGPSGEVEFAAVEEKPLTSGPSLTVPLAGDYETRLTLFAQTKAAGLVGIAGNLRKNATALTELFSFFIATEFAASHTTNGEVITLAASDVLTIGCKLGQAVKTVFKGGQLSIVPVRVG